MVVKPNNLAVGSLHVDEGPSLPVADSLLSTSCQDFIDSSPRHGGQDGDIVYVIYWDSGNGKPRTLEEILVNANQLFEAWGGLDRLKGCLASE